MIVDTSSIVAILQNEPESMQFSRVILSAETARISAGTVVELAAVCARKHLASQPRINQIFADFNLRIEPLTVEQANIGSIAYRNYGIGSGHDARLNFGDCFAYALAKSTGEPLLFKGNDFIHTDITPAI